MGAAYLAVQLPHEAHPHGAPWLVVDLARRQAICIAARQDHADRIANALNDSGLDDLALARQALQDLHRRLDETPGIHQPLDGEWKHRHGNPAIQAFIEQLQDEEE